MKDNFKLYAVYDIHGDVLRHDITRNKKYWETKKAAMKAVQNYCDFFCYDISRFKVVEINCSLGDFYDSETGENTI